ncbi:MAG: hypothetical protein NVS1B1_00740 [Candidatus Limnocylindrales bacterium]
MPVRDSTSAMSGIIEYLCAEPLHQLPEDAPEPVILYLERLAYCPAGAVDGHDWRGTGGKTLGTVRDWLARPPVVIQRAG